MALPNPKLGAKILAHLLQIHPTQWTVFGNRRSQLEESWMLLSQQLVISSLVHGQGSREWKWNRAFDGAASRTTDGVVDVFRIFRLGV